PGVISMTVSWAPTPKNASVSRGCRYWSRALFFASRQLPASAASMPAMSADAAGAAVAAWTSALAAGVAVVQATSAAGIRAASNRRFMRRSSMRKVGAAYPQGRDDRHRIPCPHLFQASAYRQARTGQAHSSRAGFARRRLGDRDLARLFPFPLRARKHAFRRGRVVLRFLQQPVAECLQAAMALGALGKYQVMRELGLQPLLEQGDQSPRLHHRPRQGQAAEGDAEAFHRGAVQRFG